MALATHQLLALYCSFAPVSSSRNRRSKLNCHLSSSFPVVRKERSISFKCRSCLSVGDSLVLRPKLNRLKISALKSRSRFDDLSSGTNWSKSQNSSFKVSYLQHEREESLVESSKVQNVSPAPYRASDEMTPRSLAIQNLFKNWLMLLRSQSQTQHEEVVEEPSSTETSELRSTKQNQEKGEHLKAVWCYLWSLDATIKIPLVVFTPLYLAVNIVYGSEVSKELTPLWILGPLIVALHVKLFWAICSLYVFCMKLTVKVFRNLPVYYSLACNYIFHGQLKVAIQRHVLKPFVMKNMDYKEVARSLLKILLAWLVERYLDFIESIWPFYCRTIRFLKRANMI